MEKWRSAMESMELKSKLETAFKNKRVLVTGHTGFKGGWLAWWLTQLGAKVTGYALSVPSEPSLYQAINLDQYIESIHGDVRDINSLSNVINNTRPEIIFHLAAQPLVRPSYDDPVETYSTNVMGTVNLLECVRKSSSVKCVINITSDKCYENKEWMWGYRETDAMGGYDPYSSSKGCAELVASSFISSFFNPDEYGKMHSVAVASARAGNVIGGGDWGGQRLIPDCVRKLANSEEIVIRNPNAIRPWQHVLEPLSGYLMLAEKLLHGGSSYIGGWNFGPNDHDSWSVEKTVSEFCDIWGGGAYRVESANLHEAGLLKLDSTKSRVGLGWQPRFNTKQAIYRSVEWYKLYHNNSNSDQLLELMTDQINDYYFL